MGREVHHCHEIGRQNPPECRRQRNSLLFDRPGELSANCSKHLLKPYCRIALLVSFTCEICPWSEGEHFSMDIVTLDGHIAHLRCLLLRRRQLIRRRRYLGLRPSIGESWGWQTGFPLYVRYRRALVPGP